MDSPLISIITPCYNHGRYLDDAVHSTLSNNCFQDFEHIIINDGSTDKFTLDKLEELENRGLKVISQDNSGLARARNVGLALSKGKYILPLDADNRIYPLVFKKAVDHLENNDQISIVYTDAQYFGMKEGFWKIGELNPFNLLIKNQIDACALIRRDVLVELGGYDEEMPAMGNEDWELWIRMIYNEKRFFYLEEIGFDYRTASNSMVRMETGPKYRLVVEYLMKKYARLYLDFYEQLLVEREYVANRKIKSILKILFNKPLVKPLKLAQGPE